MKLQIKKGTTSKLLDIFIQDSSLTTGAGLTGLTYSSSGLTAYYYREGAASAVAITLATMTLGTWATGGFVVIDGTNMPGCYQLSIPDAALLTGANSVVILLKGATNMAPLVLEIELVDNLVSDVKTVADTIAVDVAGLDGAAMRGTDNAALASVCTEGRLSELDTANLPTDIANIKTDTAAVLDDTGTSGVLVAPKHRTANFDGTAQGGAISQITLAAGASSINDIYLGQKISIYEGTGEGQSRGISSYNGTTKVVAVARSWVVAPDITSKYRIEYNFGPKVNNALQVFVNDDGADLIAIPNLDATISSRSSHSAADVWSVATRTLTSFGTLIADVWAYTTRILTAGTNIVLVKGTGITGLNDLSAAQVNAEVVDTLNVDTYAEPGQEAPAATTTLVAKIGYLYKFLRNRITQTSTQMSVYADNGTTVDQKSTVSDNGTTFDRNEIGSGP